MQTLFLQSKTDTVFKTKHLQKTMQKLPAIIQHDGYYRQTSINVHVHDHVNRSIS